MSKKETKEVKPTITLRRALNGKGLADGWIIALEGRHGVILDGESALHAWLASGKHTAENEKRIMSEHMKDNPLADATRKIADYPHLLALAWKLCQTTQYRPCRTIRLFGSGAEKLIADIDAIRQRNSELKQAVTKATAAMIESAKNGKVDASKMRAVATATEEWKKHTTEVRKPAEKEYAAKRLQALALVNSIANLRTSTNDGE